MKEANGENKPIRAATNWLNALRISGRRMFFQGRCVRRVTTYKRTPLHSAALKHMVGCVSRICKMAALGLATGSLQVWRRSCGDSRGQKSDQEFGSVFWTIPLKDCTITNFGNAAPNQAAATRRYRRSPSLISET
jgi:hypothetical protein